MIELNNITVSYGSNVVYRDFSFAFPAGVNAVLGASGSGKTTLLNVICGLTPHTGNVQCPPVAVVFQQSCLAPTSVLNNVAAVLRGKDARKRAEEMLLRCRIADKASVCATSLSGGEQQRVALARAFAVQRPVLLLDEPFNSLDFGVKHRLYQTLNELLAQHTETTLLVTHDVDEALLLADRVYLLSGRPATLSLVAELSTPRADRTEGSPELAAHRRRIQEELLLLQ